MILVGSRVRGRGFYCSATGSKFTVHDTVKFGTVMFYKDYIGNASAGYVIKKNNKHTQTILTNICTGHIVSGHV